jgi:hypothetical protein
MVRRGVGRDPPLPNNKTLKIIIEVTHAQVLLFQKMVTGDKKLKCQQYDASGTSTMCLK